MKQVIFYVINIPLEPCNNSIFFVIQTIIHIDNSIEFNRQVSAIIRPIQNLVKRLNLRLIGSGYEVNSLRKIRKKRGSHLLIEIAASPSLKYHSLLSRPICRQVAHEFGNYNINILLDLDRFELIYASRNRFFSVVWEASGLHMINIEIGLADRFPKNGVRMRNKPHLVLQRLTNISPIKAR